MINFIWAGLIIIGIVIGTFKDVILTFSGAISTVLEKDFFHGYGILEIIKSKELFDKFILEIMNIIGKSSETVGVTKELFNKFILEIMNILGKSSETITNSAIDSAKLAVTLSIGLIGIMALWLGLMKIAEEAGLVRGLGNLLSPVMKRLFPEIPKNHPAMGSIVANVAANFFGLGNAATPLGIKAMQELQELNDNKEEASNAMVLFLAINTSSVTLISSSVISYRVAANSANSTEIIAPTIVATLISTVVAIVAAKILQKLPAYKREKIGGGK